MLVDGEGVPSIHLFMNSYFNKYLFSIYFVTGAVLHSAEGMVMNDAPFSFRFQITKGKSGRDMGAIYFVDRHHFRGLNYGLGMESIVEC